MPHGMFGKCWQEQIELGLGVENPDDWSFLFFQIPKRLTFKGLIHLLNH